MNQATKKFDLEQIVNRCLTEEKRVRRQYIAQPKDCYRNGESHWIEKKEQEPSVRKKKGADRIPWRVRMRFAKEWSRREKSFPCRHRSRIWSLVAAAGNLRVVILIRIVIERKVLEIAESGNSVVRNSADGKFASTPSRQSYFYSLSLRWS